MLAEFVAVVGLLFVLVAAFCFDFKRSRASRLLSAISWALDCWWDCVFPFDGAGIVPVFFAFNRSKASRFFSAICSAVHDILR